METCERLEGGWSNFSTGATNADKCQEKAEEYGKKYIYWQSQEARANVLGETAGTDWCHIYSSCAETRTTGIVGTNYELKSDGKIPYFIHDDKHHKRYY